MMDKAIFPSVMAKNQQGLDQLLVKLKDVAPVLHLDVVDGRFAPNHSLDFNLKLKKGFRYQMHLMVGHPERWVKKYWDKVDLFIPQIEALKSRPRYFQQIQKAGKKVAFAVLPTTKISTIVSAVREAEYVLVLTVQPGFYGGKFLPKQLKKIKQIKKIHPNVKVIVDGDMNLYTIREAAQAGADYFVSGHFVTKAKNSKEAIMMLEKALA